MMYLPRLPACWMLTAVLTTLPAASVLAKHPKPSATPAAEKAASGDSKAKDAKVKDAKPEDSKAKDGKTAKPEAKPAAKEAEEAKSPHKVKKGPFRIEVSLDGVFEAPNASEILLRPQEWPALSVLKAVEHGTEVKQGDLILQLETEKIDRAIADLRTELQLNELSLKQAEQSLAALEKAAPLDAQALEQARRTTQEDWKQYLEVEKPLALKTVAVQLEMAKEMVEYQEEELRQLEKMYKADDLTEETERIVLKRARDAVKRAHFYLERTKAAHDEALKYALPRFDEKMKDATQRAEIDFQRAKAVLPLALGKQRLEFEKLKVQRGLAEEKLTKLLADRAMMTVKAPADGILYYGKCVRGKWSPGVAGGDVLRRGSPVLPNDVVMTVIQPRPLVVHTTVPEAQIQHVRAGLQGIVEPAALDQVKLPAIMQRVSSVPITAGSFDAVLTVAVDGQAAAIMPGMACSVKLVPYKKADALTIPPKALFTEEDDPLKQYVYVLGKGDKPEKRPVTAGKRNDKQVEVQKGLAEGDQVLLEKPKE